MMILRVMPMGRKARYDLRRAQLEWILGGVCAHCGTAKDLQFDHIDLDGPRCCKSGIWRQPWDRVEQDIGNLQLLCGPCHAVKNREDFTLTAAI